MPAHRWRSRLATGAAMADAFIRAARAVATEHDLARLMEAVTADLGFRHYALIHHTDLRGSPPRRIDIKRYPDAITARIIGEGRFRRDPVIRACTFADGAFLWSELDRIISLDRQDRCCLEEGVREGLNEGITVPCSLLGDLLGSRSGASIAVPGLQTSTAIAITSRQNPSSRRTCGDAAPTTIVAKATTSTNDVDHAAVKRHHVARRSRLQVVTVVWRQHCFPPQ